MRTGLSLCSLCFGASLVFGGAAAACGSSGGSATEEPEAGPSDDSGPDTALPDLDSGTGADVADAKKDVVVIPMGDRYCTKLSPVPRFCDDFDDGDLTNDWDVPTVSNSVIDLDDSVSTSAPYSFVVQTKALTTVGTSSNGHLRKTVLGNVGHAKLSFSAFFPAVTFTKGIIAIATLDVSSNHYFTLNLRDQDMAAPAASLEEFVGATMVRHVLTALPPVNVWTRVTLDLDFAAGKANLSFDTTKALTDEPITATPGTEATVRLGAVYVEGPADVFLAHYDDVVVDF